MIRFVVLIPFVFLASNVLSFGADPMYPVSSIPEAMKKGAHAVYRTDEMHFTIEAIDRSSYIRHEVVTILDKSGDSHALFYAFYSDNTKIKTFDAVVYNAKGEVIEKLKKSDIRDESAISEISVFEDNRVKYADLSQDDYPYTVEFNLEVQFDYLYSIPDWVVRNGEDDAYEHSVYTLTFPEELKPRYKMINFDNEPLTITENGLKKLKWEFHDFEAIKFEPYSKRALDTSPIIRVAPGKFKFDDYEGSMQSWDDIAKWQMSLNAGRNTLSQERLEEVRQLVEGVTSEKEKIRMIYEYMQKRTRYVSIQLGIGGFQPFETGFVDETGYGDCKALSFYTQALLESVGIESYYTWVYGGDNPPPIDPDFPDDNFNHIILCVPTESDTVWLECTSQTKSAGYMGGFTGGRDVLLITEDGGKIVHTPEYNSEHNMLKHDLVVEINDEGNAEIKFEASFIGQGTEFAGLNFVIQKTAKEQKDWIQHYVGLNDFKVFDYAIDQKKGALPQINIAMNIGANKIANVSSKRVFFEPNLVNRSRMSPKKLDKRTSPVYIGESRKFIDHIQFKLPQNLYVEYLPETTTLNSDFGDFKVEYEAKPDGIIIFKRTLEIHKGEYSPDRYNEFFEFFKEVNKLDKQKIVMSKST